MNALTLLPAPTLTHLPDLPLWAWPILVKIGLVVLKPTLNAIGEWFFAKIKGWLALQ